MGGRGLTIQKGIPCKHPLTSQMVSNQEAREASLAEYHGLTKERISGTVFKVAEIL